MASIEECQHSMIFCRQFDFESKKEIIRIKDPDTDEVKETETGNFIFENEWQSFRTRQDRSRWKKVQAI